MSMLTTIDNPYDPYTDFDNWYAYDEQAGYHTCSYLARIASNDPALSDKEIEVDTEAAIDEIVRIDPFGIYIKLTKKVSEDKNNKK